MSEIKNDGLDQYRMAKCKALTGSAVKWLKYLAKLVKFHWKFHFKQPLAQMWLIYWKESVPG